MLIFLKVSRKLPQAEIQILLMLPKIVFDCSLLFPVQKG